MRKKTRIIYIKKKQTKRDKLCSFYVKEFRQWKRFNNQGVVQCVRFMEKREKYHGNNECWKSGSYSKIASYH